MADYGVGRMGGSLRDALNQLYPMTGLGEYTAGYPPDMTLSRPPFPGGPIQQQPGLSRPPLPGAPVQQPGLTRPPLPGGPQPQPGLSRPPLPGGPVPPGQPLSRPPVSGAVPPIPGVPPNPETVQAQLMAGRMQQQPGMMGQGPPNYAAQLGLTR